MLEVFVKTVLIHLKQLGINTSKLSKPNLVKSIRQSLRSNNLNVSSIRQLPSGQCAILHNSGVPFMLGITHTMTTDRFRHHHPIIQGVSISATNPDTNYTIELIEFTLGGDIRVATIN